MQVLHCSAVLSVFVLANKPLRKTTGPQTGNPPSEWERKTKRKPQGKLWPMQGLSRHATRAANMPRAITSAPRLTRCRALKVDTEFTNSTRPTNKSRSNGFEYRLSSAPWGPDRDSLRYNNADVLVGRNTDITLLATEPNWIRSTTATLRYPTSSVSKPRLNTNFPNPFGDLLLLSVSRGKR